MAVWQGTQPGSFGGVDVWKHQVTLFLRARETFDGDPPTPYYRMFRLITKGIPTAAGVEMLNATVHPSCYPMDLPHDPAADRCGGAGLFRSATFIHGDRRRLRWTQFG